VSAKTTWITAMVAASIASSLACGGPASETEGETEDAVSALPIGFYQTGLVDRGAGDISTLSLNHHGSQKTFWWYRCDDTPCTQASEQQGSYRLSTSHGVRYVRFYVPNAQGRSILAARYAYRVSGSTLLFQASAASSVFSMDVVGESLCDDSGGSWTDDDFSADGLNCVCGPGGAWSTTGCTVPNTENLPLEVTSRPVNNLQLQNGINAGVFAIRQDVQDAADSGGSDNFGLAVRSLQIDPAVMADVVADSDALSRFAYDGFLYASFFSGSPDVGTAEVTSELPKAAIPDLLSHATEDDPTLTQQLSTPQFQTITQAVTAGNFAGLYRLHWDNSDDTRAEGLMALDLETGQARFFTIYFYP
jgi:hypothetical protein